MLSLIKVKNAVWLFIAIGLISGFFKKLVFIYFIILLHELGHIFFILLFKRKIKNLTIHPYGAIIDLVDNNDSNFKDILIALGGIIVNILLMPFLKGELSEINKYILIFNMLPIYPLDGGLVIKGILSYFVEYKRLLKILPFISIVAVGFLFFVSFSNLNMFLILIILLFRNIEELKNYKLKYQAFLLNKYINPNIKLNNRFINRIKDVIYHFYKGFNNNQGFKEKYIDEENILKDYYRK